MGNFFSRLLAAVPDMVTCAAFLAAWIVPSTLGPDFVNGLIFSLLVALFAIFSGVVYSLIAKSDPPRIPNFSSYIPDSWSRTRKFSLCVQNVLPRLDGLLIALSMGAVILLILINVLNDSTRDHQGPSRIDVTIDQPELLVPFVWIYASQFIHLLIRPTGSRRAEGARMETLSTLSVAAFVASFLAAIALPLPPLGMTPEFVATLQRHNDVWGTHQYIPIAFGAFYFALQACLKYALSGPASRVPERSA